MSKTLIIVRHAKSDWTTPNTADIDRPLNDRGSKDARLMGDWLNEYCHQHGIRGIHANTSTATRAESTCKILLSRLQDIDVELVHDEELYLASRKEMLNMARNHLGDDDSLMLVGHNPGMHELVASLSGEVLEKFPTGAIACIEYDIAHWSELAAANRANWQMMRPKKLRTGNDKD